MEFVLHAEDLYSPVANQVSQANPEAGNAIQTNLTELKAAWPSVIPPQTPAIAQNRFLRKSRRLQQMLSRLPAKSIWIA